VRALKIFRNAALIVLLQMLFELILMLALLKIGFTQRGFGRWGNESYIEVLSGVLTYFSFLKFIYVGLPCLVLLVILQMLVGNKRHLNICLAIVNACLNMLMYFTFWFLYSNGFKDIQAPFFSIIIASTITGVLIVRCPFPILSLPRRSSI